MNHQDGEDSKLLARAPQHDPDRVVRSQPQRNGISHLRSAEGRGGDGDGNDCRRNGLTKSKSLRSAEGRGGDGDSNDCRRNGLTKSKSLRDCLLNSVPFVQIHEERHKKQIRRDSLKTVSMLRIFFETEDARNTVAELIEDVAETCAFLVRDAKSVLTNPLSKPKEQELCFENLCWDGVSMDVIRIDDKAPDCYGLEIAEMLFWEAYVMMQDCDRPAGSEFDTGRPTSEPEFQEKNFDALRRGSIRSKQRTNEPVCLFQMDSDSPMSPQTLVVAYEKVGMVEPASSEFYYRYY